jgi:galactokinase
MMGGGFGGCTINLVKEEAAENLIEESSSAYKKTLSKNLTAYVAKIAEGGSILKPAKKLS